MQSPADGGNCELLTHAITFARGFDLPRVRSSELYTDTAYTLEIPELNRAQTGDIIGLSDKNKKGYRGIHMGVLWIPPTEIFVIHNVRRIGHATQETLSEARQSKLHERIAWIKRPTRRFGETDLVALQKLGLGHIAE